jgi:hypothetical protein
MGCRCRVGSRRRMFRRSPVGRWTFRRCRVRCRLGGSGRGPIRLRMIRFRAVRFRTIRFPSVGSGPFCRVVRRPRIGRGRFCPMRLGCGRSYFRRRRMVRRADRPLSHPGHRRCRRSAMIRRESRLRIAARLSLSPRLLRRRLVVVLAHRTLLFLRGLTIHAARTVEAGAVVHHRRVVDHGPVDVDVSDHGRVYVHHGRVVLEHAARPASAVEPDAAVSESVIDAAVKPDRRAPVACIPSIESAAIAPVARRPKQPRLRRLDPGARHPVVAVVRIPGPVARCPQKSFHRTRRLHVYRQYGRRKVDRYRKPESDLCWHWPGQSE